MSRNSPETIDDAIYFSSSTRRHVCRRARPCPTRRHRGRLFIEVFANHFTKRDTRDRCDALTRRRFLEGIHVSDTHPRVVPFPTSEDFFATCDRTMSADVRSVRRAWTVANRPLRARRTTGANNRCEQPVRSIGPNNRSEQPVRSEPPQRASAANHRSEPPQRATGVNHRSEPQRATGVNCSAAHRVHFGSASPLATTPRSPSC